MLKDLHANGVLDNDKHVSLQKYVLETTGAVYDADPACGRPNQDLVLSHASFKPTAASPKAFVREKLDKILIKLQSLRDDNVHEYRKYDEFEPARALPSQLKAFAELRRRLEHDIPILICIVAPAGYGKTELLSALLHYLSYKSISSECVAVTGVAASQIAGTTVHALVQSSADGTSNIFANPEKKEEFAALQIIIFDEHFMAEEDIVYLLIETCQQIPLRVDLRRRNSLPLFGYRDVILCGDIRQLPPASGKKPFWGTGCFRSYFEVFVLEEDRRHERDSEMRNVKELLAWGGIVPDADQDVTRGWPVDERLHAFIVGCYLRGWGLSGDDIDPDIGTALFPKRRHVRDWNDAVICQIEEKYGDTLDAVDVYGADPTGAGQQLKEDKRVLAGIQTLDVLRLRTNLEHRMRVMCTHNINIRNGWVNGSRLRLRATCAWTGSPQKLQRAMQEKLRRGGVTPSWCAQKIWLMDEKKHPEFNVYVVKDEECTLT